MTLKLWGRANSINVQKVLWCLGELGLPFEHVAAGGAFGIVDTPEYRRLNPNGLVPTLEDDGFVLWESNAIVRYLAAKESVGTLSPADPQLRAAADRWMDWQATEFTPATRDAFIQLVRTPPERRDAAAIERSLEQSERLARILDTHLAAHAYVAGDAFSMGDVATGTAAHRWLNMTGDRPSLPHLEHWHSGLRAARPPRASSPFP